MVTKEKIDEIEPSVRLAVDELFDKAKNNQKIEGDFIIFLANGVYDSRTIGTVQMKRGMSPYVIDHQVGLYKDTDRVQFYVSYLNSNPALFVNHISDEDQKSSFIKYCTTSEMMIYSHIWESSRLLTILKHLANLLEGELYNWKLIIPDFTRHEFIRNELRDVFKKHDLKIAEMMSRSYHSQVRNAFAHSDYSYSNGRFESDILLWNYEDKYSHWQKKGLKFDEWDERFAISITLAHYLLEKFHDERKRLGENVYKIYIPDFPEEKRLRSVVIMYKPEQDSFSFIRGSSGKYPDNVIFL